jgi:aminoglycoside phosphotransferase (APT) family kinase protein
VEKGGTMTVLDGVLAPDASPPVSRSSHAATCLGGAADEVRAVADAISNRGWPAGFEDVTAGLPFDRTRALHREMWLRHAGWKGLLDPRYRGCAVVVETGYGSTALSLAENFDRVVAIVPEPQRRRVMAARAEFVGVRNITFVDCWRAAAAVDVIAVYGYDPAESARIVADVAPLHQLTADGAVYIGVKDAGLRRGGLQAHRRTARLVGDLRRSFPAVTRHFYSDELTRASELSSAEVGGVAGRLRAMVARYSAPAVGLLGVRSSNHRSLFASAQQAASRCCADAWNTAVALRCERQHFATPEGFVFLLRCARTGRRVVLRLALNRRTAERFRTNYDTVEAVARQAPSRVPTAIGSGEVAGTPFYVETMLEGRPLRSALRNAPPARRSALLSGAVEWLGSLQHADVERHEVTGALLASHVIGPAARAMRFLNRGGTDAAAALQDYLCAALRGQHLPFVRTHGDYSVDNILVNGRGAVSGVFDWDLSCPRGLPLLDVIYLLASEAVSRGRVTFADALLQLWSSPDQHLLESYCAELQIPSSLVKPLVLLQWCYHLAYRIDTPEAYRWPHDEPVLEGRFLPTVLEFIRSGVWRQAVAPWPGSHSR